MKQQSCIVDVVLKWKNELKVILHIFTDASEVLKTHPPNLIFQSEGLKVKYDQLVQAPSRIWCELVKGHSVMIVWDKGELVTGNPDIIMTFKYNIYPHDLRIC